MGYTIYTQDRIKESASIEDIENGDGYETAYIVIDENGEIVMDTTNEKAAMKYLLNNTDEIITEAKEGRN